MRGSPEAGVRVSEADGSNRRRGGRANRRRVIGPRDAYAASASFGGAIAPVIIATASDIVCFFGIDHRQPPAEAMDVDAVGDLEHMRHVVRDQDDRQAALLHVEDQLEHAARFLDAERRRRLVHDDDAACAKAAARATATPWRWPPDSVSTG